VRTTIQDVAKAAGVSPATVSRVLNGHDVSPDRAERVHRAVHELDYQPNGAARALRRQVADVWSAIVADVENPFFTSVVRGLEDAARASGYRVILCNSDEELDREREYFDVAIAERVGGVVVAVASTRQSRLDSLLAHGIPVVAIDRRPLGHKVDCVLVDNRLGARRAVGHLIDSGARSIACITGPSRISTANERLAGAEEAAERGGVELRATRRDFRVQGGHDATMELFKDDHVPDALFVANNLMTVGAMTALRELGVHVPHDVLVVGFDDAPWTELTEPALTVVSQPTYEIGTTAAQLLLDRRAARAAKPRDVVLEPRLIIRGSSVRP
jgi:LacI family transcriptional regulator